MTNNPLKMMEIKSEIKYVLLLTAVNCCERSVVITNCVRIVNYKIHKYFYMLYNIFVFFRRRNLSSEVTWHGYIVFLISNRGIGDLVDKYFACFIGGFIGGYQYLLILWKPQSHIKQQARPEGSSTEMDDYSESTVSVFTSVLGSNR